MLPAATLLAGLVIGLGFGVWAIRRFERASLSLLDSHRAATAQLLGAKAVETERLAEVCLELAHKLSAPEQAAVDHIFDKDRQQQEHAARKREADLQAAAIEGTMRAHGLDPDEFAGPVPDPEVDLISG